MPRPQPEFPCGSMVYVTAPGIVPSVGTVAAYSPAGGIYTVDLPKGRRCRVGADCLTEWEPLGDNVIRFPVALVAPGQCL